MELNNTKTILFWGFSLMILIFIITVTIDSKTYIYKESLINSLQNKL